MTRACDHARTGLPRIQANSVQIQQVVLNLARNAFEALVEMPASDRAVDLTTLRTGSGDIEIRISDNGPGIAPGIADRLFDPFITTKKSGTGLGLADQPYHRAFPWRYYPLPARNAARHQFSRVFAGY